MTLAPPARIAFAAALTLTLYMALTPHPPRVFLDPYGDKIQHFSAFGLLTGLAMLGFPRVAHWLILEHMSFLGALIEVGQTLPFSHRDCDWADWVVDTIAAAIAVVILGALMRRSAWLRSARALGF